MVGCYVLLCLMAAAEPMPSWFSQVALPAQARGWTPEVSVDFAGLLRKLGVGPALDPGSVRATTADGEVLPTCFVPEAGAPSRGTVRWNAPAGYGRDGQAGFRVYFAPLTQVEWTPVQPEEVGPANLVANPGFERGGAPGRADDWVLYRGARIADGPGLAHRGANCLEMRPSPDPNGGQMTGSALRIPGGPAVNVQGHQTYRFGYWLRAVGTVPGEYGLVSLVEVHWLDADRKLIAYEHYNLVAADTDWKELALVLAAPAGARGFEATISFNSTRGALYIDDVAFVATQPVIVDSAQASAGGAPVRLGVDPARSRRFDFTPDASVAWPGFTPITAQNAYNREAGFGWLAGVHPPTLLRHVPDAMARGLVLPAAGSRLAVDLPDGDYAAWFLIGDSATEGTILPAYVDWSIAIDGREVLTYRPSAAAWYREVMFRNMDDWWAPGVDTYDRFVAPRFEERRAAFTVRGGQATFEFGRVPLCAMALFAADAGLEAEEELAQLRRARKRAVTVTLDQPTKETAAGLAAADRKRGYALFARDTGEVVLPGSAPRAGEAIASWSGFAAPGQYVSFRVSLYPLQDVGSVAATLSGLAGPGGARIPVAPGDVGVVRYMERPLSTTEYRYTVAPVAVQPRNPMPVPAGVTTSWVVRLAVPAGAAPGLYRGALRLAPASGQPTQLPVTLRVVPIRLGPTPIPAGFYHLDNVFWYHAFWIKSFGTDPWLREQAVVSERRRLALLREYGVSSLAFCDDGRTDLRVHADGAVDSVGDQSFVQWMDLYRDAGMGPMPWYGFSGLGVDYLDRGVYGAKLPQFSPAWDRAYRAIIDWAKATEKARGWPELIMYLSDELSNEKAAGAEKGRQLVQRTKDIPGIRTVASLNGSWEKVMLPGLKLAMPNHAFPITRETLAEIAAAGCELWLYNIGDSRVTWGLYPWRVGARGRFQWATGEYTAPWNPFDADSGYCMTRTTLDAPLPTLELIALREGIDDLRYLVATETAIAAARRSGRPRAIARADAAQRELDRIRASLPEDARLLIGAADATADGGTANGEFATGRRLDSLRWLLASHTLMIQDALAP